MGPPSLSPQHTLHSYLCSGPPKAQGPRGANSRKHGAMYGHCPEAELGALVLYLLFFPNCFFFFFVVSLPF